MTSEVIDNPAITDAPSEPVEAPSEIVEFVPSEAPDAEPTESTGEETPEVQDETEVEEPEQTVPTVESALEKRRAIDRGDTDVSLTAEEFRLLREHDRAEDNRRRDFERNEAERQKQVEALQSEFTNATNTVVEEVFKLSEWISRFGGADDPVTRENVSTRLANLVQGLQGKAEQIVMEPHLERQREMLKAAYGESPSVETLRNIAGLKTQEQLLGWTYEMGRAQGQTEGAPEGKVLVDKKEYDRLSKADKVAAKAGGGDAVPPPGRPSPRDSRSDAEILADPNTPIETLIEIRNRQKAAGG